MEFLGDKGGQFVQALLQVVIRGCPVKNRFKIRSFRETKRLNEAIFPLRVEVGKQVPEDQKHSLPGFAANILLRINEFSEKFWREDARTLKSQKITGYFPMCSAQISCLDEIYRPEKSRCGSGSRSQ